MMTSNFNRIKTVLYLYPLFWFSLLVPLWGGVLVLMSTKYIYRYRSNPYILFLLFFLFLQILSLLFSVFVDTFQLIRLFAMVHNIAVYVLLICGVVLVYASKEDVYIKRFVHLSYYLFVSVFFVFCMHYLTGSAVSILLPWGDIALSRDGYFSGNIFPRVSFLVPYVNALGVLAIMLYGVLSLYHSRKKITYSNVLFVGVLLLAVAVMAGSRTGVLIILALIVLNVFYRYGFFSQLCLLVLAIVVGIMLYDLGVFDSFFSVRAGSTETRLELYIYSLELVMNHSPLFGIGQKPIINFEIPIGSHSTYIGYVVKNGLLGLMFVMTALLYFVYHLFTAFVSAHAFRLQINMIAFLVMLSLFTEDIDSFEVNALLFGFFMGLYFSSNKKSMYACD